MKIYFGSYGKFSIIINDKFNILHYTMTEYLNNITFVVERTVQL